MFSSLELFFRHSNAPNRQEDSTARAKKKTIKKPKSSHTIVDPESDGAISSGESKSEQKLAPKRPITTVRESESDSELSEDESY